MSGSLMKKSLVTLSGLFIGVLGMASYKNFTSPKHDRKPSAIISNKSEMLRSLGKNHSVLKAQIVAENEIPENNNKEVTLIGYIGTTQTSNGDVRYSWVLPDGVRLVSGDIQGSWSYLSENEAVPVEIVVTGFSKALQQQISLNVSTIHNDFEFVNSAMISSRPEDSLEYLAPTMMAIRDKEKQAEGKVRGRIVK